MADYDHKSRVKGVERSDAYQYQPASVCSRSFVFGCIRDLNGLHKKVERHRGSEAQVTSRYNKYGSSYGNYEGSKKNFSVSEPTLIHEEGWTRPTRAGWAMPPEVPLGKVTNNVDTAADMLRESVRPHSPNLFGADRWSSAPSPSNQAKKTSTTIDSDEAARKYHGKFIW